MNRVLCQLLVFGFVLGLAVSPMTVKAQAPDPPVELDAELLDKNGDALACDVTDNGAWEFAADEDAEAVSIDVSPTGDSNFTGTLLDDDVAWSGASVTLYDGNSNVLDTDTTDANGAYSLFAGMATAASIVIDWGPPGSGPTEPTGTITTY